MKPWPPPEAGGDGRDPIPAIFLVNINTSLGVYVRELGIDWREAFRRLGDDRKAWAARNGYTVSELLASRADWRPAGCTEPPTRAPLSSGARHER